MLYLVATLTPFDSQGRVDLKRLRAHVLWLTTKGVDGFVPTGTTGEFLYLTEREREAIHRTVIDTARGRPVYPCTWDPSPRTTAYLSDAAREQGASGVLLPPPLYYKLDDDVVGRWYRSMHQSVKLPILAYHNPSYVPTPISAELYAQLRAEGVLAGLKDSSRDPYRLRRLTQSDRGNVFAGGDSILGEASRIDGLAGFISGLGNVWPSLCIRVFRNKETDLEQALSDRVAAVKQAGGIRALKALMRMGFRPPILPPDRRVIEELPPPERI